MRELKNVEERILDRALYLMGKKKSCNISIRAIAKEANVNVSAINYYFRSKEEMLRLVKEFYIQNSQGVLSFLKNDEYTDEERLLLASNEIMEYALQYPGNMIIYTHSLESADSDPTSKMVVNISQEIGGLLQQAMGGLMSEDKFINQYKYLIFISSVNYPTESESIASFDRSWLEDKETRMNYIKAVINSVKSL
ncbi:TetR/AcrR family transcriptional regulator ['Paenibacillus yunnanensis' Narsing Rao et al. 2020]|uniref:TetR/AcrR family transcriptional regulator n=1 Tax=Paenibacillus tengchongensis TaxID=2608684 RepID=UPI00124CBB9F|nr:TetR/AcrR family transcriptional regulator [Paenibacillus tengchongensis]